MIPRLESSTKWTSLPEELSVQIERAASDLFPEQAREGKFLAEGRIYPEEFLFRLGYVENERLVQINFETSSAFNLEKDNIKKIIDLSVDCSAALMEGFFKSTEMDYPRDWKRVDFDGRDIFVQHTTVNSELEKQADKLLGEASDALINQSKANESSEEFEAILSSLGVEPSDIEPTQIH